MRFALRPYIIAGGAAIAAAGVIVMAPAAPPLPDVRVPAVAPAGSELSGFNSQDPLEVLINTDGMFSIPDNEVLVPATRSPDLGGLINPKITPPELGPLDLGGLDLSAVPPPGNPPATQ